MDTAKKLAVGVAAAGSLIATAAVATAGPPAGPPPPKSTTGAKVVKLAGPGAVPTPTSFAFGAGTVFAGSASGEEGKPPPRGGVFVLKGGAATLIPGTPKDVYGLAWKAGKLYVSSGRQLLAFGGWNGTRFASRTVLFRANKNLTGLNGLAFGPNGRLYAGVGLEFKYEHKTDPSKYGQAVVSFKRDGSDLRLVAQGLRQPFQLTFVKGHRYPFVSNLSQDETPKVEPPDFVVYARPGQDYGFAKCTWFAPRLCRGYSRPFKFFPKHTSPMGIAPIGQNLYIAQFNPKKPRVVRLSVKTKKVTPVLTGFVAPVVGLNTHNAFVYVGDLTGSVYRVKG
jgi:glucose/arabinose dehydrogenase